MAKKTKRRSGPPSRERVAVMVRVPPAVSSWLDDVAAAAVLSKSAVVERLLVELKTCRDAADAAESSPGWQVYARSIMSTLAELGLLEASVSQLLAADMEREREEFEQFQAERRLGKGK